MVELLTATLPYETIFADMGNSPEQVHAAEISRDSLVEALRQIVPLFAKAKLIDVTIKAQLRLTEPFKSNWIQVEPLLSRMLEEELGL